MAGLATFWKTLVRWQKNTIILTCVLALYALLGFVFVPQLGQYFLENQVSKLLQRQVNIEKIKCNPFALTLDLHGLTITEKDSDQEFIGLDSLHLDLELSSLWQLALVLRDIRLQGPRLHICLDEQGRLNFSDLIKESTEPTEASKGTILDLIIEPFILEQGRLTFTDNMHQTTHVVDQIHFHVPRISSRQKDWKTFMTPALSFRVKDAPFMLQGRTIPFDNSLRTQFDLDVVDLDLLQYWSYVPFAEHLRLEAGTLALNFSLIFEQHADSLPTLSLSGHILGQDLDLADQNGTVLAVPRLEIAIEDIAVFKQQLIVQSIIMDQPVAKIVRQADEALNWVSYFKPDAAPTQNSTQSSNEVLAQNSTKPNDKTSTQNSTEPNSEQDNAFMFLVRDTRIINGRVEFLDESLSQPFKKELHDLNLRLTNLGTASTTLAQGTLSLDTEENEHLNATASLSLAPFSLAATVQTQDLDLPTYTPFFKEALPLTLATGKAEAQATITMAEDQEALLITDTSLTLHDLSLVGPDKMGNIALQRAHLDQINLDLAAQSVETGVLNVEGLTLATAVDAQGRGQLLHHLTTQDTSTPDTPAQTDPDWTVNIRGFSLADMGLQTTGKTTAQPLQLKNLTIGPLHLETKARQIKIGPVEANLATSMTLQKNNSLDLVNLFATDTASAKAKTDEAPWAVSIERLSIADSILNFTDATLAQPLSLGLDQINVQTANISTDLGKSIPLSLSCRVDKTGSVQIKGNLIPETVNGQGKLTLTSLPLSLASPYLTSLANIKITSGQLGGTAKWQIQAQGKGQIQGDLRLDNLRVTEGKGTAEILSWQSLALRGLDFGLDPLALRIGQVELTAPKAGFIIDKQGRTTLDRVLLSTQSKQTAASTQASGPTPQIKIGPLAIKQGRFSFVDQTISPRFETLIAPLDLTVSGFSLDPAQRSEIDLSAIIDGSAPITAQGWIAPAQATLAADSTITLHNFDLTSLSAYAAKFVAHPITKGHLDWEMQLNTADTALSMGNAITARQLELGNKVASDEALDVPIKLGLSLLRDLSGNIKINLPVKGDLSDPKFSIGGIVVQAFLGLIIKAIASPFSLLAGLLPDGADQDLSKILFPPGLAQPAPETLPILQGIADIMAQRPAIALTLVGHAATNADRQGLEDVQFLRKLQEIKFADLPRRERSQTMANDLSITEEEYADLLWKAYKDAPVDKEKGFLGMTKEVSREIQEEKLRELIHITDNDLLELASQRAKFVQNYLQEQGIDPGRVEVAPARPESLGHAPEVTLETRQ